MSTGIPIDLGATRAKVVHAVKGTDGLVAGLLPCVALISLVVGGIGIMNIMLDSLTERIARSAWGWLLVLARAISFASSWSKLSCFAS